MKQMSLVRIPPPPSCVDMLKIIIIIVHNKRHLIEYSYILSCVYFYGCRCLNIHQLPLALVTKRCMYAFADCHLCYKPHGVKITQVSITLGALNLKMKVGHIASFFTGLTTLTMIIPA
jgi:hypothetical protein